jgi:hypothetical protein
MPILIDFSHIHAIQFPLFLSSHNLLTCNCLVTKVITVNDKPHTAYKQYIGKYWNNFVLIMVAQIKQYYVDRQISKT